MLAIGFPFQVQVYVLADHVDAPKEGFRERLAWTVIFTEKILHPPWFGEDEDDISEHMIIPSRCCCPIKTVQVKSCLFNLNVDPSALFDSSDGTGQGAAVVVQNTGLADVREGFSRCDRLTMSGYCQKTHQISSLLFLKLSCPHSPGIVWQPHYQTAFSCFWVADANAPSQYPLASSLGPTCCSS